MNIFSLLLLVLCVSLNVNGWPVGEESEDVSSEDSEDPETVAVQTGSLDIIWSYNDTEMWSQVFKTCDGKRQSPIDIESAKAIQCYYSPFNFSGYEQTYPMIVTNNLRTVVFNLPENVSLPSIQGGGLPDNKYSFVQLHFHWGNSSRRGGSEHLINSQRYPGELHIVHYNDKYGSFEEATKHEDGLAVLGILIELQERENIAFRHILEPFRNFRNGSRGASVSKPIPLMDLLPDNVDDFYRYNGSLTTPGCQEIVFWTVFDTPIAVSEKQLAEFRKLHEDPFLIRRLESNFRPLKPIEDRIITYRSESGQPLRNNATEV